MPRGNKMIHGIASCGAALMYIVISEPEEEMCLRLTVGYLTVSTFSHYLQQVEAYI